MSVKLMSIVWDSNLPTHEKFVALALADHGSDDGAHIYPSVSTVAKKVGKSDRSVQRTIHELVGKGILEVVKEGGGRGNATRYQMNLTALKGEVVSPFTDDPDSQETVERVTPMTQRVTPVSPEPLEPSEDPDPDPDLRGCSSFGAYGSRRGLIPPILTASGLPVDL